MPEGWENFEKPDPDARPDILLQPDDVRAQTLEEIGSRRELSTATANAYQELVGGFRRHMKRAGGEAAAFFTRTADGTGNPIVAVGLGLAESVFDVSGHPGAACIHLYTSTPLSKADALRAAADIYQAPDLLNEEAAIRVINSGAISLCSNNFRVNRPTPCGVSVGHRDFPEAGTMGCLCRGRGVDSQGRDRSRRLLALSCNHVLANTNAAAEHDPVYQPGNADELVTDANCIGVLERAIPIDFTRPNWVDCAAAWVDPKLVAPEQLYVSDMQLNLYRVGTSIQSPQEHMPVGKSGRTTGLTFGHILSIGLEQAVLMPNGMIADFANQFSVVGAAGPFAEGGDSGSLVWHQADPWPAIGLVIACSGGISYATPMEVVAHKLGLDLV